MEEEEDEVVPLPNVNAAILKKVIQWATYHKDDPPPPEDDENKEKRTDDISSWDSDFLKVDQGTLFELILAANYLDIKVNKTDNPFSPHHAEGFVKPKVRGQKKRYCFWIPVNWPKLTLAYFTFFMSRNTSETFLKRIQIRMRLFQKNQKIPFLVIFCQFQPHFIK
jgi:hypothetical protein